MNKFFAIIVSSVFLTASADTGGLAERTIFPIPLAKIYVKTERTGTEVRITYSDSRDQFIITGQEDKWITESRLNRETRIFAEPFSKAFGISDFEARQLDRVCKTFSKTLEMFEHDLHHERWDRCLYLDSFFPRFLKGFYYLYSAARNSGNALSRVCRIPDSAYDVSLNSPKSDLRIAQWKSSSEYVVKLRIAAKELQYQMRQWQKNELNNPKRDMESVSSPKFEEAYSLFIKMYFNVPPPPPVPEPGKHL